MKEFYINERVLQALVNYLANQPWREVNDLINALQSLQPVGKEKGIPAEQVQYDVNRGA